MTIRLVLIRVATLAGLVAAAAVPQLAAEQGSGTKGGEVSTVRPFDLERSASERLHAEKQKQITARLAGASGASAAFVESEREALASTKSGGVSARETLASTKAGGVSTIDDTPAEPVVAGAVQITPAESASPKLEPFATIEQGPSELSPLEMEKARSLEAGTR